MKKYNNISEFANAIVRNAAVSLVTLTIPSMRKTANPYVGRVQKRTEYSSVVMGRDYEATCTKRGDSEQFGEYKAEKPNGKTWVLFPFVLRSDKDPNQQYVRFALNANYTAHSTYYVDGRKATDAEVEEIKSFIPPKKPCAKQAAYGVQNEVRVMDVKIENIVELAQGEHVFKL